MIPRPLSRRALCLGAACALVVLSISTSFIRVARFSATRTPTPFDIAFLRFLFSGLPLLTAVSMPGEPLGGAALAGLACVTAGLLFGLRPSRGPAPRLAEGSA